MSTPAPAPTPSPPACWNGVPFTIPIILDPSVYNFMSVLSCPWQQWAGVGGIVLCCLILLFLFTGGSGDGAGTVRVVIQK